MSKNIKTPPLLTETSDYLLWKKEISIWQVFTDVAATKQGPALFLSLTGKAREAVLELDVATLQAAEVKSEDGTVTTKSGVTNVLEKLDSLYLEDTTKTAFLAYDAFERYQRPQDMDIKDYIIQFERLYNKVKSLDMTLPEGVLAYRLLKGANLSEEREMLARATISDLTFKNMCELLKKIFSNTTNSTQFSDKVAVKVEPTFQASVEREAEDVYYNNFYARPRGRGYRGGGGNNARFRSENSRVFSNNRGSYSGDRNSSQTDKYSQNRKTNPVSRCAVCHSIYHWAKDCPYSYDNTRKKAGEKSDFQLISQVVHDCYIDTFVGETLGYAVLDTGCTKTVCGKMWLKCYEETLDKEDSDDIVSFESDRNFKFGDGRVVTSERKVIIPAYIGEKKIMIETEVVDSELPLLFSKEAMKKAKMTIDFTSDTARICDQDVHLQFTSSGHYTVPLMKNKLCENNEILFSIDVENKSQKEKYKIALKLHLQFGHPRTEKLQLLLKTAGMADTQFFSILESIESNCETCIKYKRRKPRPIVGLSLGKEFNDSVAMDLKSYKGGYFLHLIDLATRYSNAVVIPTKNKEVIVKNILLHWIAIFGSPNYFLSDNGGEFNNKDFQEMSECLNIEIHTTAAESPWSNGIVERHNGVIGNMVDKILEDSSCDLDVALAWAISAKNSLHNVYGYSPNQLVFGKNPNLPCVLNDKPPALEGKTSSELIAENLNALHAARKAFVHNEASEKVRRALRNNIRPVTTMIYNTGDKVYYKRLNSEKWKGPAEVIGHDSHQVFVKHGGMFIRVHPCSLRLINADEKHTDNTSEKSSPTSLNDAEVDNTPVIATDDVNNDSEDDSENVDPGGNLQVVTQENAVITPARNVTSAQNLITPEVRESDPTINKNILPPLKCHIEYRMERDDPWKEVITISRAGKSTGKNRYWMNVKDVEDESIGSMNFEDVNEWRIKEEVVLAVKHENHDIVKAKQKELENWKEHKVYHEVEDIGQNYISTRWVLTERYKDGITVTKARLVARGFEESEEVLLRTDSPTCCKENLRLIFTLISSHCWKIYTLDIKSAFLQGKLISREIFLKPPVEAGTCNLWKLTTTVYGLSDASRIWYLRVKEELLKNGVIMSKYDEAIFYWRHKGIFNGVVACHVDDFCWGGSDLFQKHVIGKIRNTFSISQEDKNIFKYLGLEITQLKDVIKVKQGSYVQDLKEMEVPPKKDKNELLNKIEKRNLKVVAGKMNWVVSQTRPDMSYDVCEINTSIKGANVENVLRINKAIRKLKSDDLTLHFPNLGDLSNCKIISYSDASFANLNDAGSQGSFLIFLLGGNGKYAPIAWQSKKIKRVVKSTLAAETLALLEGAEHCYMLKSLIAELLMVNMAEIPIICITDNKSLFDSAYSTKTMIDKRLKVDICVIRNMLENKEISEIKWVAAGEQLANCLTKTGASRESLFKVLSGNGSLI